jgi:hypothetical protein
MNSYVTHHSILDIQIILRSLYDTIILEWGFLGIRTQTRVERSSRQVGPVQNAYIHFMVAPSEPLVERLHVILEKQQ